MAFEINVNVNFPALDKIATILCMNSEGLVEKAVNAFVRATEAEDNTPAVEEVVIEDMPVEEGKPKKRTRKAKKVEEPVEVKDEEDSVTVESDDTASPVEIVSEVSDDAGEKIGENSAKAEQSVEPEPVASGRDYTLAELSNACMKLRDKNPALLDDARKLFGKYGVTGLAGLKGDQAKLNGFAADMIALGAVI